MSRRGPAGSREERNSRGEAPHSRLFILGGKGASEDEFKEAFGKYGEIDDIWIVKDKRTNEDKGVVYITFHKTSEAALAQEEMNGRLLPNYPKPMKVMIASDRKEGSVREQKEEEKMLRLFIKIPRTYKEDDLEEIFKEYGDIDYVNILRDKNTGDSRGLGYVKYHRAYHAALALEQCDSTFRAMFAARKTTSSTGRYSEMMEYEYPSGPGGGYQQDFNRGFDMGHGYGGGGGGGGHSGGLGGQSGLMGLGGGGGGGRSMGLGGQISQGPAPMDLMQDIQHSGTCRLEALVSTSASQEQVYRLFDLVPGLEFCDFNRKTGVAFVRYQSPQCAAYAKDKINGLEYPTGYRMSVRTCQDGPGDWVQGGGAGNESYAGGSSGGNAMEISQNMQSIMNSPNANVADNLQTLVESIKQATSVLQAAGISQAGMGGGAGGGEVRVRYCNVPLPEKQGLLPRDTPVAERLFLVSQPDSFPENILTDCLCRFGNLVNAYFMPGRNYGYAKFASKECAQRAMDTLHGQTICGQRMKVLLADPPKYADDADGSNMKKQKI